jgi:hypothetical protein
MQSALAVAAVPARVAVAVTANVSRTPFHIAVLLVAGIGASIRADVVGMVESPPRGVAFPLGEHYRVGRYVPAIVQAPGDKPATLAAGGAVGVQVPAGTATAVPLLAIGTLSDARLALGKQPVDQPVSQLRPLRPDQRLVGVATDVEDAGRFAGDLFPAKAVVRAPLGRIDPLPGSAMAWSGLDAVLLDPSTAARVSMEQLTTLRAAGVAVAIQVDARPAGDWPWQRRGAWWVLPPDESAAVDVIQSDRYAPVGELAGASRRSRQIVVALLACFAIAAVGVSLWRSRRAWVGVVALSAVAAGGIVAWNSLQSKNAELVVEQQSGEWLDRYTQHVARADGEVRHAVAPNVAGTWPILFSPNHARDVNLVLHCRPDGTPDAFVARLKRGQSLVFLERVRAAAPTPAPAPATAPATRTR